MKFQAIYKIFGFLNKELNLKNILTTKIQLFANALSF